jgi:hypothetical protein
MGRDSTHPWRYLSSRQEGLPQGSPFFAFAHPSLGGWPASMPQKGLRLDQKALEVMPVHEYVDLYVI